MQPCSGAGKSAPIVRVDQINAYLSGGAAAAARRIHEGLRAEGIDSHFWYNETEKSAPAGKNYHPLRWKLCHRTPLSRIVSRALSRSGTKKLRKIVAAAAARNGAFEIFSMPRQRYRTYFRKRVFPGSIVHLHWISDCIDYGSFFPSMTEDLPLVWTFHDMNPVTGGCHYTSGCDGFTRNCGDCPQLATPEAAGLSRRFLALKRKSLRRKSLHVVTNSEWLEREVRRSRLSESAATIRTIRYGIDTDAFAPRDRDAARETLGLRRSCPVVLFGADSVDNRRKGIDLLIEALRRVTASRSAGVTVLVFGRGRIPPVAEGAAEVKHLGFVDDADLLRTAYSASDLFVIPSLEEAVGQTGLEALACGTPVVGFDAGGIPEYVIPGTTGLLARKGSAEDLAEKILRLLADRDLLRRLGAGGRELVERRFGPMREIGEYRRLYEEVTGSR